MLSRSAGFVYGCAGYRAGASRGSTAGRCCWGRGAGLVAELAAAAGHEVVELGADRVVQRRRGELLELLPPDLAGPGGGVLGAQLEPALEVGGGGEHRAVEALAEPLHRVRRAEEVAAVPDLGVGAEGEGLLGDLQRGELDPQLTQQLD